MELIAVLILIVLIIVLNLQDASKSKEANQYLNQSEAKRNTTGTKIDTVKNNGTDTDKTSSFEKKFMGVREYLKK